MEYKVNSGIWGNMFGVPCIVADNLLKFASGDNLKVLLYVLRNSGTTVKTEEISANTGVAEQLVEESILFWEQFNIFSHENSTNQPHSNNINIVPAPAVPEQVPQNPVPVPVSVPETPQDTGENAPVHIAYQKKKVIYYKPSEIAELKMTNPDIAELLQMIQGVIANPNNYIVNSVIWAYQYLGLKVEVIMTLLNYCLSMGKTNAKDIDFVAENWYENGINTIDEANKEVERLVQLKDYRAQFMRVCDNMQATSEAIDKMIEKCQKAGFNMEMIKFAYEATLDHTGGKIATRYMDGIFKKWIDKGFKTIDDVKNDTAEHKKNYKPKNSDSDNSDASEYEIFWNNF